MNKNPFLKRLIKEESADVMHSSAYAEVQNEGSIGAASAQSFAERQKIEANRTMVRGYRDSKVVNDAFGNVGNKLHSYDAAHDASQRAAIREKFGGNRESEVGGSRSEDVKNNVGNNAGRDRSMPSGRTSPPPARRNPGISR